MRLHSLLLPAALALALTPLSAAHAQQCAEGRVSTPETLGRCCWPGQSFSETLGRCSGPPQCPPPFVAEGDSCLVPYTAGYGAPAGWPVPQAGGAPRPDAPTPPGARAPASAPVELRWPDEPPGLRNAIISPRLEAGVDEGLLTAGLSLFLGGYLGGLVLGGIDEAAQNCQSFALGFFDPSVGCGSWPYAFIPVAGGVLAGSLVEAEGACCRNAALGIGIGIPLAAVQIFGLTLTGLAIFGGTETLVPGRRGGEPTFAIVPYATEREAGTWLRVEL